MDYIIIAMLGITIMLLIINLFKKSGEAGITERLGKLEVGIIKEIGEFKVGFSNDIRNDFDKLVNTLDNPVVKSCHFYNEGKD